MLVAVDDVTIAPAGFEQVVELIGAVQSANKKSIGVDVPA
jgi:hypothetical protein